MTRELRDRLYDECVTSLALAESLRRKADHAAAELDGRPAWWRLAHPLQTRRMRRELQARRRELLQTRARLSSAVSTYLAAP